MSRIGKIPIDIPQGVKIDLAAPTIHVEGPKGALSLEYNNAMVKVERDGERLLVRRLGEGRAHSASHGLYQRLIFNMIKGVTEGYRKELEIVGVGYRAQMEANILTLQVGLSHQPRIPVPEDLKITVPKPTRIIIEGIDKQKVGQLAAEIRKIRPPEPYKGKGIRYSDERVRRKVGKAGAK